MKPLFNKKQLLFKELVVGTLIYAVVLGFFNDYTSIVYAKSFSYIFFASFVLEILTILAFSLKGYIANKLKGKEGTLYKVLLVFNIWLIMFLSKFIFVEVIDLIFGNDININGFFGILIIVLSVTIIHRLAEFIFLRLG